MLGGTGGMGGGMNMGGPQMNMVSQLLQKMRSNQPQQQGGGMDLMSLLPMLFPSLGGGTFNSQAMGIGQQGLGLANQSPLSLMNPNYGLGR